MAPGTEVDPQSGESGTPQRAKLQVPPLPHSSCGPTLARHYTSVVDRVHQHWPDPVNDIETEGQTGDLKDNLFSVCRPPTDERCDDTQHNIEVKQAPTPHVVYIYTINMLSNI